MEDSPNANSATIKSVESIKKQDVGYSNHSIESSKKDDDLYSKSSPKNIQSKSMASDVTTKKADTRNSVSSKSSKNALKLQSTKKEPQKEKKTLGAEFEIKSISTPPVKVSVETDYFADMGLTPVITKGTTSEHSIQKDETTNKSSSAVKASNPLTFTVDENSQLVY